MSKTSATTKALAAVGLGAIVLHGMRWGMEILGSSQRYRLEKGKLPSTHAPQFAERLAAVTGASLFHNASITVLRNGPIFYPAQLAAIDAAQHSINLQAYEFVPGDFTRELVRRLATRARAGVQVRILIDALGSFPIQRAFFAPVEAADGRFAWFHPITLRQWPYFDHRSHRKLLTIDGRTGFIGGADYADHWIESTDGTLPWRDTVFQVEGGLVHSLNAAFAQNWVESSGEILFSDSQFPASAQTPSADPDAPNAPAAPEARTAPAAMVVKGRPGHGTSNVRILFQALIDAAQTSIEITSPYFLPDHSARRALIRAAQRGVRIRVLTAGRHTDHDSVRRLSEALCLKLMRAGIAVYEYIPSMIHAKLMTVDGIWSIGGSTNFDPRSFALNDEVNLAIFDPAITTTLLQHFEHDLAQSKQLSPATLHQESLSGKLMADLGWLLRNEE